MKLFVAGSDGAIGRQLVRLLQKRIMPIVGGVSMMTTIRGGSNARAERELGWEPLYPSWRRGFAEGLG